MEVMPVRLPRQGGSGRPEYQSSRGLASPPVQAGPPRFQGRGFAAYFGVRPKEVSSASRQHSGFYGRPDQRPSRGLPDKETPPAATHWVIRYRVRSPRRVCNRAVRRGYAEAVGAGRSWAEGLGCRLAAKLWAELRRDSGQVDQVNRGEVRNLATNPLPARARRHQIGRETARQRLFRARLRGCHPPEIRPAPLAAAVLRPLCGRCQCR